jgi:hypothetical protein
LEVFYAKNLFMGGKSGESEQVSKDLRTALRIAVRNGEKTCRDKGTLVFEEGAP